MLQQLLAFTATTQQPDTILQQPNHPDAFGMCFYNKTKSFCGRRRWRSLFSGSETHRGEEKVSWGVCGRLASSSTRGSHRILVPLLLRVIRLPAAGREDVFVLLVPASQHHLTGVRLRGETKAGGAGFASEPNPKASPRLFPPWHRSPGGCRRARRS